MATYEAHRNNWIETSTNLILSLPSTQSISGLGYKATATCLIPPILELQTIDGRTRPNFIYEGIVGSIASSGYPTSHYPANKTTVWNIDTNCTDMTFYLDTAVFDIAGTATAAGKCKGDGVRVKGVSINKSSCLPGVALIAQLIKAQLQRPQPFWSGFKSWPAEWVFPKLPFRPLELFRWLWKLKCPNLQLLNSEVRK